MKLTIFFAIFSSQLLLASTTGDERERRRLQVSREDDRKFYSVKHLGIPFLAKAGMKVATTAARIKGGQAKQIAEAGSIKLAVFENQDFDGDLRSFAPR